MWVELVYESIVNLPRSRERAAQRHFSLFEGFFNSSSSCHLSWPRFSIHQQRRGF